LTAYNVISPSSLAAGQPEDVSVVLANLNAIASVINGQLDNGNLSAGAAIAIAKLAGYPADATKALLGDGTWGAAGLSLATALPGVPTDGQMVALTDSLTAPTYVWPLRYNATATRWYPFGEGWGFGTAIPTPPALVDRVVFVLVNSLTNPTYKWKLQWNLTSTNADKWEYIGGTEAYAAVGSADGSNQANSVWSDYAPNFGPEFIVPRAGIYRAWWGIKNNGNAAGSTTYVGLQVNGVNPPSLATDGRTMQVGNSGMAGLSSVIDVTIPGSGSANIRLVIRDEDTGRRNASQQRWLAVRPVRIS
jgi:hypothetical protein